MLFSAIRARAIASVGFRFVHSNSASQSAGKSPLLVLRQKTGLAYNLCREALNKHNNNVGEAEAWLKAQALAHGLQKATKVSYRAAREGLICMSVHPDNQKATVVELNCETDFVAKNQLFKDFAIDLTEQVLSTPEKDYIKFPIDEQKSVEAYKLVESQMKALESQVAPLIMKLGENIRIDKAITLRGVEHNSDRLFGQIHSISAKKQTSHHEITAGRFGAVVALKLLNNNVDYDDAFIRSCGDRLCRHVIGFNPSYIELPTAIRKHLEQVEQGELDRKSSTKTDDNVEEEYDSDREDADQNRLNNRDDWPSIMDQTLIMSDDTTVRDFCKENNLSITFFHRYECGIES